MALHVKKGDTVEVIAGNHRGTRGRVLRVDPVRMKVVVEGVNRVYRHVRPSRRTPQGGRIEVERPLDASNVLPIDPKTDLATRVRFVVDEKGQKTRVSTQGNLLDVVSKSSE